MLSIAGLMAITPKIQEFYIADCKVRASLIAKSTIKRNFTGGANDFTHDQRMGAAYKSPPALQEALSPL